MSEQTLVACWCGSTRPEGVMHYPGGDPEDGPAHLPRPGCQCEHVDHFDESVDAEKHPFNSPIASEPQAVRTAFGTYTVCERCANTCLKNWRVDS